jgi:hypothetical protein
MPSSLTNERGNNKVGLFKKLLGKLPGSPTSVAKVMLKKYTELCAHAQHQGYDPNDCTVRRSALRYAIETRYQLIKSMSETEMDQALSEAGDSLFALIIQILVKENPYALQPPMVSQTLTDLYSFFRANAPEQIEIYERKLKAEGCTD